MSTPVDAVTAFNEGITSSKIALSLQVLQERYETALRQAAEKLGFAYPLSIFNVYAAALKHDEEMSEVIRLRKLIEGVVQQAALDVLSPTDSRYYAARDGKLVGPCENVEDLYTAIGKGAMYHPVCPLIFKPSECASTKEPIV